MQNYLVVKQKVPAKITMVCKKNNYQGKYTKKLKNNS